MSVSPRAMPCNWGWSWIGEEFVELADGAEKHQLVFAGSVHFFSETREVKIMLTDSEDALIGTRLLNHFPLTIEFPGGQVKLRSGAKTLRQTEPDEPGVRPVHVAGSVRRAASDAIPRLRFGPVWHWPEA